MRKSAGILLFRKKQKKLEVFLVHPGGPFWKGANRWMGTGRKVVVFVRRTFPAWSGGTELKSDGLFADYGGGTFGIDDLGSCSASAIARFRLSGSAIYSENLSAD